MAEQPTIKAESRELMGTRVSRRYRKAGKLPVVLAHKSDKPVHLLVNTREFNKVVMKRARIIGLTHPGGKDKVFIREIQYDHLDEHPIHVDFTRVDADEVLTLEVGLELKGKPVGVIDEGGVLDQFIKVLRIECLPDAIPEIIEADVSELKINVVLSIKDLAPPQGVKILNDPDLAVARVTEHKVEEVAVEEAAPGPLEPEVIKKEKEEGAADEGGKKEEKKEKEKKEKK